MFGIFSKKTQPIELWFKTDIHNHVLPGIDDGSPDIETSLNLIRGLNELGIERIIASPHVAAIEFPNTPQTLDEAYRKLLSALDGAAITVPVTHSAEYRLDEAFPDIVAEGKLIPYPNKYVLIENQWIQEPWDVEQVIFDLQLKGYQPIFAHPERFTYYHKNMKRLEHLHDKIPFQINVLSLAGYYGNTVRKFAEALLKNRFCDFLGTDTHRQSHIDCIRAYLSTADAKKHRELSLPTLKNDKVFNGA